MSSPSSRASASLERESPFGGLWRLGHVHRRARLCAGIASKCLRIFASASSGLHVADQASTALFGA